MNPATAGREENRHQKQANACTHSGVFIHYRIPI